MPLCQQRRGRDPAPRCHPQQSEAFCETFRGIDAEKSFRTNQAEVEVKRYIKERHPTGE